MGPQLSQIINDHTITLLLNPNDSHTITLVINPKGSE